MSKIPFKLLLAILIIEAGIFAAYFVYAEVSSPVSNITFPVAELNNCKSETECRTYCNDPQNIDVCVDFAQKHGLISQEEAARAKQFKDVAQSGGPGSCKNQNQCESYCEMPSHMDECVSFAEKHNLMSADELSQAKKVNQALKQGARLPGDCRGKQQCESYCKVPAHAGECLDFATKSGMIPSNEAAQARKMLELVQSGDAPQACLTSKEQCQSYCSEPTNREQCTKFMVKGGFMKPEDAEAFKKTGGKGPGNCQSKEECESFCSVPENQETCFNFGKENGLIPADSLRQIEENSRKTKDLIDTAPPAVKTCLQSAISSDVLQKIESGTFLPNQRTGEQIGEQMRKCFEQFLPKPGVGAPGEGGSMPPGQGQGGGMPPTGSTQFRGPGGCSNVEECAKYCSDPTHQNECKSAGAPQPGNRQGEVPFPGSPGLPPGPGGGPVPSGQMPAPIGPPIPAGGTTPLPIGPPPGNQPIQSPNPQMPLQSIQYTPPQNIQPYPSGQPAPMPIPSSGVQPSTSTPPPPPSSSIDKFFGEIIRFLITPQI